MIRLFLALLLFLLCSCQTEQAGSPKEFVLHPDLSVNPLSSRLYIHISQLPIPNYGKFSCNGLIYLDGKEAFIFDTPVNDTLSNVLLDWLENERGLKVNGVIATHFHVDCTGGLRAFHQRGIPSYGYHLTQSISRGRGEPLVENTFSDSLYIEFGKDQLQIQCLFAGPGHSPDNIVVWLPKEKTLFGGCLIKSLGSGKGNLADATPGSWSQTVEALKNRLSDIESVIPGHGAPGTDSLLDFTIGLFQP